jgi:hypothetical protein
MLTEHRNFWGELCMLECRVLRVMLGRGRGSLVRTSLEADFRSLVKLSTLQEGLSRCFFNLAHKQAHQCRLIDDHPIHPRSSFRTLP